LLFAEEQVKGPTGADGVEQGLEFRGRRPGGPGLPAPPEEVPRSQPPPDLADRHGPGHEAPALGRAGPRWGEGKIGPAASAPGAALRRRPVCWPLTLRRVQGWLAPWVLLWRWWQAWSTCPPPPELRALLDAVGQGHPLYLYLRC
jgi:hypothetical protein